MRKLSEAYVGACFQEHKERSKVKLELNIRILVEKYGVEKTIIDRRAWDKKTLQPTWKSKRKLKDRS
jgi:hypothetical protein